MEALAKWKGERDSKQEGRQLCLGPGAPSMLLLQMEGRTDGAVSSEPEAWANVSSAIRLLCDLSPASPSAPLLGKQ